MSIISFSCGVYLCYYRALFHIGYGDVVKKILVLALLVGLSGCEESSFVSPSVPDIPEVPEVSTLSVSFDDYGTWFWYKYALPVLETYDVKATFFVNYPKINPGDPSDPSDNGNIKFLDWLHEAGQLVGHHTCNHISATKLKDATGSITYDSFDEYMVGEIDACAKDLEKYGPITKFAYPYGNRSDESDAALLKRFESVRGFHVDWSNPIFDKNEGMSIDAKYMDWDAYYAAVDYAVENGLSLHVTTHDVYDDCAQAARKGWAICAADLARVLDYAQSKGMKMSDTPE